MKTLVVALRYCSNSPTKILQADIDQFGTISQGRFQREENKLRIFGKMVASFYEVPHKDLRQRKNKQGTPFEVYILAIAAGHVTALIAAVTSRMPVISRVNLPRRGLKCSIKHVALGCQATGFRPSTDRVGQSEINCISAACINTDTKGFEPYTFLIEEHKVNQRDMVSTPATSYRVFKQFWSYAPFYQTSRFTILSENLPHQHGALFISNKIHGVIDVYLFSWSKYSAPFMDIEF